MLCYSFLTSYFNHIFNSLNNLARGVASVSLSTAKLSADAVGVPKMDFMGDLEPRQVIKLVNKMCARGWVGEDLSIYFEIFWKFLFNKA